jgi:chromosome segregation ATPase
MVRRLRQQLKRRDGMIFDMQEQIIDQDLAVASHQEHIANLKVQLEESSNLLFASKQEVQHLERALADLSTKLDASSKDCSGFDYGKVKLTTNKVEGCGMEVLNSVVTCVHLLILVM